MYKIAFLIPVKTQSLKNSKLYNMLDNINKKSPKKYIYNFYLGFDNNDKCLNEIDILTNMNTQFFNINIIKFDKNIKLGHVTKMWNILFQSSYNENDYFYQLGDDIIFYDYDFITKYIDILKKSNDLGVTGYLTSNGNNKILTQSFVSKKHMEIFGYYFPENIINWYCDDWISKVYHSKNLYLPISLKINYIVNSGGTPRYIINNSKKIYEIELIKGIKSLESYIQKYS